METKKTFLKQLGSECIGTYLLVLIGTGSVIVHDTWYSLGVDGIAICFGVAVYISVLLFGKISGSHINPAVSLVFFLKKEIDIKQFISYLVFQLFGALLASITLRLIAPDHPNLGATFAKIGVTNTFFLETFLTFLLLFGILLFSHSKYSKFTGLVAAIIVALEAYFAGPLTGASMNPARSIAPAFVSGNLTHLWVYIAGPFLGGIIALILVSLCFKK